MKKNRILAILVACLFTFTTAALGALIPTVTKTNISTTNIKITNSFVPADATLKLAATPAAIEIDAKALGLRVGDTVTMTGTGATVTFEKITEATTSAAITASAVTLNKKGGTLKVTVTPATTTTYSAVYNNVKYDKQKSPVVTASAVTIETYADQEDVLTVTGAAIEVGDVLSIYETKDSTKAASKGSATKEATKASVKFPKKNITTTAGIYLTITHKDCLESDKVFINNDTAATYKLIAKSPAIVTTSAIAVPGGVLVSGLTKLTDKKEKYTVTVYKSIPSANLKKYQDKTDKDALKAITLGKAATISGGTDKTNCAFIAFKPELDAAVTKVYVVVKKTGATKALGLDYSEVIELTIK